MIEDQIKLFKEELNKILSQYEIQPLVSVEKLAENIRLGEYSHRFTCVDRKGTKYFLKINFPKYKIKKLSLENEIGFFRLLEKKEKLAKIDHSFFNMQKYLASGTQNLEWILYYYLEGEDSGNIFSFNSKFINSKVSLELSCITAFMEKMHKVLTFGDDELGGLNLEKLEYDYFFSYLKENIIFLENILDDRELKKLFDFFAKNKQLLNNKNFLSHRDNHPRNFIIDKKGKISIIDWSSICFSNYMYDFAEIWIHAFMSPVWQKKILETHMAENRDKSDFEALFRMMVIYMILKEIKHLNSVLVAIAFGDDLKGAEIFKEKALGIHTERLREISKLL